MLDAIGYAFPPAEMNVGYRARPEGDAVVCGPPAFNEAVLGFLARTRLSTTELLSY